jgi:hypothetical protein
MTFFRFRSLSSAAFILTLAIIPRPAVSQSPQGCIGIGYLAAESGKPFSAQIITSSKSRTETGETKSDVSLVDNFVARDRDGRIRDEKRPRELNSQSDRIVTLTWPDGTTRSIAQSTLSQMIMISDCSAGTVIQISPAMRYAIIHHRSEPQQTGPPRVPYSAHFLPNANTKSSPNLLVEDLGIKDIQGIPAHGVRHTTLGTEVDGDWNGKPLRETAQWVSDELAAMMLIIEKDFRTGRDTRWELANIQRGDPDPALFTIPPDFKIDPKIPEDLPRSLPDGSGPFPQD